MSDTAVVSHVLSAGHPRRRGDPRSHLFLGHITKLSIATGGSTFAHLVTGGSEIRVEVASDDWAEWHAALQRRATVAVDVEFYSSCPPIGT